MDKIPEDIKKFQSLLEQQSTIRPLTLYKSKTNQNVTSTINKQRLDPQSIISNVAKQIKAIQNAENVKNVRKTVMNMEKYKKSKFLPLNMLQEQKPPPPQDPQNFDTQLVSDTQLIDIVEHVEALEVNTGMTQEFETTFLYGHENTDEPEKQNPIQQDMSFPILDISLKEPDPYPIKTLLYNQENENFINKPKFNDNSEEYLNSDTQVDNCSQVMNECIEIEDTDEIEDVIRHKTQEDDLILSLDQQVCTQRPSSPVFNVKSKKQIDTPVPPMVFDLDVFENFEKIAWPVVEQAADNEEARFLINSQIIGKELILRAYEDDSERGSPIIEIINDTLKVDKEFISIKNKGLSCKDTGDVKIDENKYFNDIEDNKSKNDNYSDKNPFKDEILFSSDEEDDYRQQSYKDLPFTCALETSFYDHSENLDKTMYVGFQTASNKSIQIETTSFSKAKSFLDSIEQDLKNEATLTELIELCESNKGNAEATVNDEIQNIANNMSNYFSMESDLGEQFVSDIVTTATDIGIGQESVKEIPVEKEEKEIGAGTSAGNNSKFEGFKTASNKVIQLSEKALEKSKKVFQDIDFDEHLEFEVETPKIFEVKNKRSPTTVPNAVENIDVSEPNVDYKVEEQQTIDDDILREFEDEIMPIEFENKTNFSEIKDEPKIPGFRTASNKAILISETALAKTRHIFQDIDFTEEPNAVTIERVKSTTCNEYLRVSHKNIGFKTASNKDITISEEALAKTKHVFNDFDMNDNITDSNKKNMHYNANKLQSQDQITSKTTEAIESKEITEHIKTNKSNVTEFGGFKTASNKNISISTKALAKSKQMFSDIENYDCYLTKDKDKEPPFYGFELNDTYIGLVEETLEKSQRIFKKLTHSGDDGNGIEQSNQQTVLELPNMMSEVNQNPNKTETKKYTDIHKSSNEKSVSNLEIANKRFDVGFKIASNKDIKISEKALARSKNIFQDINENNPLKDNVDNSGLKHSLNFDFKFQGFQTASNKEVNISAKALAMSKTIFQDINDNESMETYEDYLITNFKGFQTAGNKEVKISKKALAKSIEMFQDIDDVKSAAGNVDKPDTGTEFKGFQTASNKKVVISKEALAKSRKIFQDINDDKDVEINKEKDINKEYVSTNNVNFKGFQTASNKEVKISNEALAKSRQMFQDIDDLTSTAENVDKPDTATQFKGFQTASNKEVKVSEASLAKSKKLFEDNAENKFIEQNFQTLSSNFKGFQTASNKEVKISAEALARSKKMFQDINEHTSDNFNEINKNINIVNTDIGTQFKGFVTASNKKVKVSADALAKSRKLFQDIDDGNIEKTNVQSFKTDISTGFKGFQTASRKELKISTEALARSRKIFQDIEDFEETTKPEDISSKFKGFQTGNNKNVEVSEKAIAKSRKLFQDIDLDVKQNSKNSFTIEKSKAGSNLKDSGLKSGNNNKINLSEDASPNSNKPFTADTKQKAKLDLKIEQKCIENFDDVDTQLLNNFEISMHETTPKQSKRSGSPILSCPKAKKRKVFQIPYSQKSPKKNPETEFKPPVIQKSKNTYNFSATYKKTKVYSLKDLQKLEEMSKAEDNIDPYIKQFDFENLLHFEFSASRNDITKSVLTVPELKERFLNSVNKKLIPDGWLEIQLKLILWKLLSYEIKFPKTMSLTCTAKNVVEQLKYRYDKELYNAERPALRKIFEKDDTSAKTLILCVAAINPAQDTSLTPELLLTDGWYIIKTVIDKMLGKLVSNGKITVGTKLVTHGAELLGSENAVSPWEDTSSIRLKIFGNSTRRAHWYARLGYHGNGAILSRLSNVAMDGGKICKLRVFVTRVYPPLYVDKFEDGSTVTRSERLEHLHQMKYETERQALLEKIYEDVEKEVLDQDSQDSEGVAESGCKRRCLESGSQIAKTMKMSRDPTEFRSHLTSTQTALLENHTTKERERLLQTIQTRVQDKMAALGVTFNRNVVTLFKVRVAGVDEKDGGVEVTRALLSIWRPNEAVIEMIKEGTWIEILNVVPTAQRYSELQISAGRQSIFSQSKYKESENIQPYTVALNRTCYPIKDLVRNPAMTTDYNEIDTAGIVFEIDPAINIFDPNKHQFQNIYLSDAEKNIVSVNFWGGLKKFGFENVLDTGQIIACTNLQKRAGNSRKNIPQYRVTEFSYFTKTPKSETARKIIEELSQKLSKIDKNKFFQECVNQKSNYSNRQQTKEIVTPYRFPNVNINSSINKIFLDSPLAQNSNKIDENLNLTGLDFDSTFKQDTQGLSPKTLLRKKQVKERIAKLERYGEPPPLSPIQIINKSKNAGKAYKSPLISKSDVSPSVASVEKNLPKEEKSEDISDVEIKCSPVICLNRTYVKRSNPVKLDFSKNENSLNEAIDEFAEEFDCSPPLSLD